MNSGQRGSARYIKCLTHIMQALLVAGADGMRIACYRQCTHEMNMCRSNRRSHCCSEQCSAAAVQPTADQMVLAPDLQSAAHTPGMATTVVQRCT
jgi:hypothetical protein